jgi:hypothetical protein
MKHYIVVIMFSSVPPSVQQFTNPSQVEDFLNRLTSINKGRVCYIYGADEWGYCQLLETRIL